MNLQCINSEFDEKEIAKEVQRIEIEDKAYNKLLKGGVSQDVALANAKLFGQFFKRYGANSKAAFDKWFNKFDVQYDVTPEETKQSLFQSAMISGINPQQLVDVVDLSAKFPSDSKLSKKELNKYIRSLIGTSLNSKDNKAILNFVKRSKRTGKSDVYIPNHIVNSSKNETVFKRERNTSVNNIVDLIKNSVLIDIESNMKKSTKPNIDNYLRFYVPIKINKYIYTIRICAENNTNKNTIDFINADVYDLLIDKRMTASALIPANKQRSINKPSSNNSITNNQNGFNPNQITIKDMLLGVEDPKGNTYFQSNNNTYYQESGEADEKLIAGFTYEEVMDKLTSLYKDFDNATAEEEPKILEKINILNEAFYASENEQKKIMSKIHVLEDAFEVAENFAKFNNEEQRHEIMLNAYYKNTLIF